MPTLTAAVSRRHKPLPAGFDNGAYRLRRIALPEGHDPNSFFVRGGNAHEFQCLLEQARP